MTDREREGRIRGQAVDELPGARPERLREIIAEWEPKLRAGEEGFLDDGGALNLLKGAVRRIEALEELLAVRQRGGTGG